MPVVVDEHCGVDEAPAARDERLSKCISPRSFRTVGYSYTNAVQVFGGVFCCHIPIPLSVALDGLRSPGIVALLGPLEMGGSQHDAVIRPMFHVGGGEHLPVGHTEVGGCIQIMSRKHIEAVARDHRGRVGSVPTIGHAFDT